MEHNLPTNFTNLLLALQYKKKYQRAVAMAKQKFYIKQINIEDLTPFKVLELYRSIVKKFYMNKTKIQDGSWFENELRVYLWLVIGYVYIHKKNIKEMDNDDWNYFCSIFRQRPPISFEFQALSLIPYSKSPKWSTSQIQLLQTIIKQSIVVIQFRQKKFKNKWNSIARQLFIRSDKQSYRTPKQCRQRWLNYLDPVKKKTGWEKTQDLVLLKTVLQEGKKWSTVVRVLKGTRTEHMVKNRFKSMVSIENKRDPDLEENQIIQKLIKQLQKELFDKKDSLQSGASTLLNIHYSEHSTENNTGKDYVAQKTASDYTDNLPSFVNAAFKQNCQNFYIPPPIFQGMQMYQFNSPIHDPYRLQPKNDPKVLSSSQFNEDNEFLMSHQQIENYMIFEGKDKENLMKDEENEGTGGEINMINDYMQKGDKINYFSEEFNVFHGGRSY